MAVPERALVAHQTLILVPNRAKNVILGAPASLTFLFNYMGTQMLALTFLFVTFLHELFLFLP